MTDQDTFCQTGTINRASGVRLYPCFYSSSPTPILGESYGSIPVNGVSNLEDYNYQFSTSTEPVRMDRNVAAVRVPPNWSVFTYREQDFNPDNWSSQTVGTYFSENVATVPSGVSVTTSTGLTGLTSVAQQAYDWDTFLGNCANKVGNTSSSMCGPYWGNNNFISYPTGNAPTFLPNPIPPGDTGTPSAPPSTDGTTVWVSILVGAVILILFIALLFWIVGLAKKPKKPKPDDPTKPVTSQPVTSQPVTSQPVTSQPPGRLDENQAGPRSATPATVNAGYY